MGRPRKVIEGGAEIEEAEDEIIQPVGDGRVPYIKNGVTIIRPIADEKKLAADGWKRK